MIFACARILCGIALVKPTQITILISNSSHVLPVSEMRQQASEHVLGAIGHAPREYGYGQVGLARQESAIGRQKIRHTPSCAQALQGQQNSLRETHARTAAERVGSGDYPRV